MHVFLFPVSKLLSWDKISLEAVRTPANYFLQYELRSLSTLLHNISQRVRQPHGNERGIVTLHPVPSAAPPLGVICHAKYLQTFRASNIHQVSSPRREEKAEVLQHYEEKLPAALYNAQWYSEILLGLFSDAFFSLYETTLLTTQLRLSERNK